jgi:hypothetical protein
LSTVLRFARHDRKHHPSIGGSPQGFLGTLHDIPTQALASYRERVEKKQKEEVKGHNHPAYEKCGPHCPRNEKYKGPEKKGNPFLRNRR